MWCVYELATFCRDKIRSKVDVQDHLLLLSLEWPSPLDPRKVPTLTDDEEKKLEKFSCLKVHCTKPADRHTVLAAIRKNWREVPDVLRHLFAQDVVPAEEAHKVFDKFVQKELIKVLRKSKKIYSTYAITEFSEQFALFFGS